MQGQKKKMVNVRRMHNKHHDCFLLSFSLMLIYLTPKSYININLAHMVSLRIYTNGCK